jgi:DNA repair photolyase
VEYTINNIYRGCSHGCIYCFARERHCNTSDFNKIHIKKDGLSIIRNEFKRITKPVVVTTGGLSDPYNPKEQEYRLTRSVLELVNEFNFGICILTKSDMVVRDIDILQKIKTHSPVNVCFTITCADDEMCRIIEPYAPTSSRRLAAIREISQRGIQWVQLSKVSNENIFSKMRNKISPA